MSFHTLRWTLAGSLVILAANCLLFWFRKRDGWEYQIAGGVLLVALGSALGPRGALTMNFTILGFTQAGRDWSEVDARTGFTQPVLDAAAAYGKLGVLR
jgi:hypothetical protein